jgi:hypothetical protein
VTVGGHAVYAAFVPTARGLRLRVSADDWERLSLATGARVEVGLPGAGRVPYFVRSVTFVEPCWQWVVCDAAPAMPGQRRTG